MFTQSLLHLAIFSRLQPVVSLALLRLPLKFYLGHVNQYITNYYSLLKVKINFTTTRAIAKLLDLLNAEVRTTLVSFIRSYMRLDSVDLVVCRRLRLAALEQRQIKD